MGDITEAYGGNSFKPGDHTPTGDFEPLPPGSYHVFIEKAEVKDTKAGDGQYLKMQLSVVGDQFEGRKIFANITLSNPSSKAVEIGLGQLAALGQALGLAKIDDSQELLEKILIVKVRVKKDPDRDPENEVKGYKAANTGGQVDDTGTPDEAETTENAKDVPKETAKTKVTKTPNKTPAAGKGKSKPPWEK